MYGSLFLPLFHIINIYQLIFCNNSNVISWKHLLYNNKKSWYKNLYILAAIHCHNVLMDNRCSYNSTDLSDHDKLTAEACEAEEEEEDFPSACPAQYCGKHVHDGCHHHLHGNKLHRDRTRQVHFQMWICFLAKSSSGVHLTCVSRPKRMSMTKKQMDHSWGRGIMAIAWGYAMNAKPGPGTQQYRLVTVYYLPLFLD